MLTFHAYGSWMPDRDQGSFHYRRGKQATSLALAARYRERQRESVAVFTTPVQKEIIRTLLNGANLLELEAYEISTDRTHAHLLAGWRRPLQSQRLRSSLKRAMTLSLDRSFGRRAWFSRGGDTSRVSGRPHFDYLVDEYLPAHLGLKWSCYQGFYR